MDCQWTRYFSFSNGKYSYKDRNVVTLPHDLPMPPTKTLARMFHNCSNLRDISALAKWDVSEVENMDGLFNCCRKLEDFSPIAGWNTSNLRSMEHICNFCSAHDLNAFSDWDVSMVESTKHAFQHCKELRDVSSINRWKLPNLAKTDNMFFGSTNVRNFSPIAK